MSSTLAEQLALIPVLVAPHSDEPNALEFPSQHADDLAKVTLVIEFEPLSADQALALARIGMPMQEGALGAKFCALQMMEILSFFSGVTGIHDFRAVLVIGPKSVFTGETITLLTLLCELAGLGPLPPGIIND